MTDAAIIERLDSLTAAVQAIARVSGTLPSILDKSTSCSKIQLSNDYGV